MSAPGRSAMSVQQPLFPSGPRPRRRLGRSRQRIPSSISLCVARETMLAIPSRGGVETMGWATRAVASALRRPVMLFAQSRLPLLPFTFYAL